MDCTHAKWFPYDFDTGQPPCPLCPLEARIATLEGRLHKIEADWVGSAQRSEARHKSKCSKVADATRDLLCQRMELMGVPLAWVQQLRETDLSPCLLVE